MEIGRRKLSDAEFSSLWSVLYQELYKLSNTKDCDASLVYNTIYIICTANSGLEEKLYWRIGDFLHNLCRDHKDVILKSSNYLETYAQRFRDYDALVESVHSLGSFLNDCIKGRKLNDFGYLLWERSVIQNLNESFFTDVYYLNEDYKLTILDSLKKIIPEITKPLLYYKEKYEKVAISKIKAKYSKFNYLSLDQFCSNIRKIVEDEKKAMTNSFLDHSFNEVLLSLEDSLFATNYYEILFNCIEFFNVFNLNNIKECKRLINLSKSQNVDRKTNRYINLHSERDTFCNDSSQFVFSNSKNTGEIVFQNETGAFNVGEIKKEGMVSKRNINDYELSHASGSLNSNLVDIESNMYHVNNNISNANRNLYNINSNIGDSANTINNLSHSTLLNIDNPFKVKNEDVSMNYHIQHNPVCSLSSQAYYTLNEEEEEKIRLFIEDQTKNSKYLSLVQAAVSKKLSPSNNNCDFPIPEKPEFREVLDSLSSLNAGFIMLKRAYSLYVESVIKSNLDILESSVEDVFLFFKSLYIFNDQDFFNILLTLFREYLLRTKPCFMKRLCNFTTEICKNNGNLRSFATRKPFETSEIEIFQVSVRLLQDKREFLNIYHGSVKSRLLSGNTDISKEKLILGSIGLSEDEKIIRMIKEYGRSDRELKIFNSAYWNIEPENHHIPITKQLRSELTRRIQSIVLVKQEDQTKKLHEISNGELDNACTNIRFNGSLSDNLAHVGGMRETSNINSNFRFTGSFGTLPIGSQPTSRQDIENQGHQIENVNLFVPSSSNTDTNTYCGTFRDRLNMLKSLERTVFDSVDALNYQIKIKTAGSELKTVRLAHQLSKVTILISSRKFTMNYYQYLVFTLLYASEMQFDQLAEVTKLNHSLLRATVNSLIKYKILKLVNNKYRIDCINMSSSGDISFVETSNESNNDVCYDSYSQALIAKILKGKKTMVRNMLKQEFSEISKINVEEDQYESALSKLIDKGILENKGDMVKFVF